MRPHRVARHAGILSFAAALALVAPFAVPDAASASVAPAATRAGQAGTFVRVTPTRLLDTRTHLGASTPAAHGIAQLKVTGRGGVPTTGVTAVVLTVTVATPAASGYVTAYPDGTTRPGASSLNFAAGRSAAVQTYTQIGSNGSIALYNGSVRALQLVADVTGYFTAAPSSPAGAFVSISPTRVLDTRSSLGAHTPGAGGTVHVAALGVGSVPSSGVAAVAITVTATGATAPGYITAYADGAARPATSNLNFAKGNTVANLVIVPVGADGKIALYNGSAGATPLVGDLVGYYLAGTPSLPGTFVATTPTRAISGRTLAANERYTVDLPDPTLANAGVGSVVLNLTATAPTRSGYLTTYTGTSNINFVAGQTVADLAVIGYDGSLEPYGALLNGSAGTTKIYADVFGYYVAAPGIGTISGTARDASNGVGVGGVQVRVYSGVSDEDQDEGTVFGSAVTTADGTYHVDRLVVNKPYIICFDARQVTAPADPYSGYLSQCYPDQPWHEDAIILPDAAQAVSLSAGTPFIGIDATLTRVATGTVAGSLTNAGNSAVAGVPIEVSRPDYETSVSTAPNGSYAVPALTPGSYDVCFAADEVSDAAGPYGYLPQCRHDVPIQAGTTTGVDVQLVAAGAVSGKITTTTGAPVKFGAVRVLDSASTEVGTADIGSGGAYMVTGLPAGTYRVCSSTDPHLNPPHGLVDACVDGVIVTAAHLTSGISEVLVPAA